MAHSLQVEFSAALLEEIFKRLTEQIHNHNVVHFTVVGLLVTNEVKEWNVGLAAHFVDELGLPKQHDVTLHLNGFFLSKNKTHGSEVTSNWHACWRARILL